MLSECPNVKLRIAIGDIRPTGNSLPTQGPPTVTQLQMAKSTFGPRVAILTDDPSSIVLCEQCYQSCNIHHRSLPGCRYTTSAIDPC